ncbi:MAG: PD-(D/E)XK nuclease family protein, partial [Lachnospiraceae bacterium]|nr:PD-(D/E)XK nuclease family protein [Lachnospiraceae bacterium]
NNLFYYATKELSQDAFICWLCSFALEDANKSDLELVNCAKNLIYEFMKRGLETNEINVDEIKLLSISKQDNNIDVLLTVFYKEKAYKIIIEDKTHTSEHDDQLIRYKKYLEDKCDQVIGIYFKTGFQSNLKNVEDANYKLFDRKDIINCLENCKTNNSILLDYREYWKDFDNFSQSYKEKSFNEWSNRQQVNGFYDEMQSVLAEQGNWAGYGYVSNKSGGFWGLWYGPSEDTIVRDTFKGTIYLQSEMKWNNETSRYDFRICTKLEEKSEEKSDERLSKLRDLILEVQKEHNFIRPNRIRWGVHMTVGEYNIDEKVILNYEKLKQTFLEAMDKYKEMMIDIDNKFEKE